MDRRQAAVVGQDLADLGRRAGTGVEQPHLRARRQRAQLAGQSGHPAVEDDHLGHRGRCGHQALGAGAIDAGERVQRRLVDGPFVEEHAANRVDLSGAEGRGARQADGVVHAAAVAQPEGLADGSIDAGHGDVEDLPVRAIHGADAAVACAAGDGEVGRRQVADGLAEDHGEHRVRRRIGGDLIDAAPIDGGNRGRRVVEDEGLVQRRRRAAKRETGSVGDVLGTGKGEPDGAAAGEAAHGDGVAAPAAAHAGDRAGGGAGGDEGEVGRVQVADGFAEHDVEADGAAAGALGPDAGNAQRSGGRTVHLVAFGDTGQGRGAEQRIAGHVRDGGATGEFNAEGAVAADVADADGDRGAAVAGHCGDLARDGAGGEQVEVADVDLGDGLPEYDDELGCPARQHVVVRHPVDGDEPRRIPVHVVELGVGRIAAGQGVARDVGDRVTAAEAQAEGAGAADAGDGHREGVGAVAGDAAEGAGSGPRGAQGEVGKVGVGDGFVEAQGEAHTAAAGQLGGR